MASIYQGIINQSRDSARKRQIISRNRSQIRAKRSTKFARPHQNWKWKRLWE